MNWSYRWRPSPIPDPAPDEVVVRIEASPINPSDLGLLFGAADMSTATFHGTAALPVVTATIPAGSMPAMAGRLDESLPVGNEGAGVVVRAGLVRRRAGPGRTRRWRSSAGRCMRNTGLLKVEQCLVLPAGTTPAEGASAFINPLTALGMVETMRREGHTRPGAHRRGVQPRSDAQPALSAGRRSAW